MATKPVKTLQIERLPVRIYATNTEMGASAALDARAIIQNAIAERGEANIILATGNSQLSFLHTLRVLEGIDWSVVTIFHMDEYIGIDPEHRASFPLFLRENLINFIQPRAFYPVPGNAEDVEAACQEYEDLLRTHPADLVMLGIGENGHLAFNDPPYADFDDPLWVKVIELAEMSRQQQVGEGHFDSLDEVPTHAITLTIPALLAARSMLCLVPETRKARIVRACLRDPISPDRPASILRRAPHAALYLDMDSAALLETSVEERVTTLPVREMVLYKHGVGFFVREGAVAGENVALTFRQDEINDVLKSLAVFDKAGGQVLGIHYQTPMDKDARLASSSIRLSKTASLRDLIADLRGRRVTMDFESAAGILEVVSGRVIGLDESNTLAVDTVSEQLVTLLADDGAVRVFRLGALRSLHVDDPQAGHDLTYFLDTSLSEDARRTVNVRLSAGEHQLAVFYVAPSPTWRVSYRLVAESEVGTESGKALLQGWGLFDNRLEEDLEDVRVTLVAGQPISFIYELYASRIPVRPTVQDETRVAPGPIEFGGADMLEKAELDDSPRFMRAQSKALGAAAPRSAAPMRDMLRAEAMQAAPPAAQAKDVGEFFQYVVTAAVSVKRGESALVPIIGSEINYQRELLYNGAKLPDHPVVALRFDNSTGLTLERGPVTIVEDGDYKGEAVVAFTKDGNQVYLPYAVELGVRITEHKESAAHDTGLTIKDAYFVYEQFVVAITKYTIENTTSKAQTVTIEAPIQVGWELADMRAPDVVTATEHRWRVNIPARSKTDFVRRFRHRSFRREEVRQLSYQKLQEIGKHTWLDEAIQGKLAEMLAELGRIQQANARQTKLAAERETLYKQQEQLRANLTTLQAAGQEAALRTRMLGQLETSQNRLEAIEHEVAQLTQQVLESEQKITQIIAGLG
ncbi:MAG: 6-phosphogluconolactonase [Anaerolineae bacterium]|nr:6-phosphogluconolactonase [Anaerolineae bacterium]